MVFGEGEDGGVVRGIGCGCAGRQATEEPVAVAEHGKNHRLDLRLGQRALYILRGEAGSSEQRDEQARTVERVASVAPEGAARTAQGAVVGLVADLIADEVEELGGIVAEQGGLIDDVGIGLIVRALELEAAAGVPMGLLGRLTSLASGLSLLAGCAGRRRYPDLLKWGSSCEGPGVFGLRF